MLIHLPSSPFPWHTQPFRRDCSSSTLQEICGEIHIQTYQDESTKQLKQDFFETWCYIMILYDGYKIPTYIWITWDEWSIFLLSKTIPLVWHSEGSHRGNFLQNGKERPASRRVWWPWQDVKKKHLLNYPSFHNHGKWKMGVCPIWSFPFI